MEYIIHDVVTVEIYVEAITSEPTCTLHFAQAKSPSPLPHEKRCHATELSLEGFRSSQTLPTTPALIFMLWVV